MAEEGESQQRWAGKGKLKPVTGVGWVHRQRNWEPGRKAWGRIQKCWQVVGKDGNKGPTPAAAAIGCWLSGKRRV